MKILYKPFALIAAAIAARLGRSAFKAVWAKIDDADPPDPSEARASLPKVVGAAALEAATMAAVGAAVDRASANAFHHLTGIWPGKTPEDSEESGE
jgi:predicted DNA-binding transcriptional regulator YafY